jgi:hypothetical protein
MTGLLPFRTTRCLGASFLLFLMGFALVAPMLTIGQRAALPMCCRRDGKHHCAMSIPAVPGDNTTSLRPKAPVCPYRAQYGVPASFAGLPTTATWCSPARTTDLARCAHQVAAKPAFLNLTSERGPPETTL